jgi:glucokinase
MPGSRIAVVDLGGTWVRVALAGRTDRLIERRQERTRLEEGPDGVIGQMARMITDAVGDLTVLTRVVVGSPGPLDPHTGTVYDAPNMTGWREVHLRADLDRLLRVPVTVMNDAKAAALGEYTYGAGRGSNTMVYLTVSTGIGGGVVVDGNLLLGVGGMAGEIGHMSIDRRGPTCKCGNIGCVEVLASGTAIARRFRERLAAGETSSVTAKTDRPTGADVSRAAEAGDPLASAVFQEAAECLGLGIVNCIHIFNPEVVVIGGGVIQAGPLLFDPIDRVVKERAMSMPASRVRVLPAALKDDAGLLGCVAEARRLARAGADGSSAA